MIPKLLVSHGGLAAELLSAAKRIAGEATDIEALSLDWDTDGSVATEAIKQCVQDLDQGNGVLILTDLFGATPTNAACKVVEAGRYELVTGINLPMVVRLACCPPAIENVSELAVWVEAKGRESIRHVNDGPQATQK